MRTAVLGTRRDEFLVLGPRGTTSWFSTYSTDWPIKCAFAYTVSLFSRSSRVVSRTNCSPRVRDLISGMGDSSRWHMRVSCCGDDAAIAHAAPAGRNADDMSRVMRMHMHRYMYGDICAGSRGVSDPPGRARERSPGRRWGSLTPRLRYQPGFPAGTARRPLAAPTA